MANLQAVPLPPSEGAGTMPNTDPRHPIEFELAPDLVLVVDELDETLGEPEEHPPEMAGMYYLG